MVRTILVACLAFLAGPATAQSSIGITGGVLDLNLSHGEGGELPSAAATIDVAITGSHGFQGDLAYDELSTGAAGRLGAHLYLRPSAKRKYGLFASISDMDGRALAWGNLGAEMMTALGDDTVLEARAGIGASNDGLDYIFGGVAVSHALNQAFEIEAAFAAADFDETALRVTSLQSSLLLRYSPEASPWGIEAAVHHSEFAGRDAIGGDTRVAIGITFAFGTAGGADPQTRPFHRQDPVATLVRRGLW